MPKKSKIIMPGDPEVIALDLSKEEARVELQRRLHVGAVAVQQRRAYGILIRAADAWLRDYVLNDALELEEDDTRPLMIMYAAHLIENSDHGDPDTDEIQECLTSLNEQAIDWYQAENARMDAEDRNMDCDPGPEMNENTYSDDLRGDYDPAPGPDDHDTSDTEVQGVKH